MQVESGAADQRALVRQRRWFQLRRFQPGEDECVNRRPHPCLVLHYQWRRFADRQECPELPLLRPDNIFRRWRRAILYLGPNCTSLHPRFEIRYFLMAEFALRRHLDLFMSPPDRLDQQALVWITRHDRRTGISALEQRDSGANRQAPHVGFAVAGETILRENGADPLLEKLLLIGSRVCRAQE